jgi:hypothetical protein
LPKKKWASAHLSYRSSQLDLCCDDCHFAVARLPLLPRLLRLPAAQPVKNVLQRPSLTIELYGIADVAAMENTAVRHQRTAVRQSAAY